LEVFAFTETSDNQRAEKVTGNERKIGQAVHASCFSFYLLVNGASTQAEGV
jgi:hypothetical protein